MELIFEGAPARRTDGGQNPFPADGSPATLNSHGGLTKEDKLGRKLNSQGDVQS